MPAGRVGMAQIAPQAEIRRMSLFWRSDTSVWLAWSTLDSRVPRPSGVLDQVQQVGALLAEALPEPLARSWR
jgi:hypothetical protein